MKIYCVSERNWHCDDKRVSKVEMDFSKGSYDKSGMPVNWANMSITTKSGHTKIFEMCDVKGVIEWLDTLP